jgi:pimeloyl-ACP methyl ester carboxylesterase
LVERRNALDDLRVLRMPALVMTGSHDASRPVAEGRAMAAAIGCAFHELPGSGHMAMLEQAGLGTENLLSYLGRTNRRSGRDVRLRPRSDLPWG